jgi:hypothetical protein
MVTCPASSLATDGDFNVAPAIRAVFKPTSKTKRDTGTY